MQQWLNNPRQSLGQLTEWLANLTTDKVLVAVGVMMVLLAIFRLTSRPKDRTGDWMVENLQVILSVVVVVFLLIRPFLFQAFYIPSDSMVPALLGPDHPASRGSGGDRLLVNKLIYRVGNPQRGDIAVFKAPKEAAPDEKEFIKRVIGLPRETVDVYPPRVVVDGRTALWTADSMGMGLSIDTTQPVKVTGNVARLVDTSEAPVRVMALPDPKLRHTAYRVEVNGKEELSSESGLIEADPVLENYGGDGKLEGTVFKVDGAVRLIVVEGKKLEYQEPHVEINGRKLPEPYLAETPDYTSHIHRELGPREYMMMGDNRNNSNDSRAWGPLSRERIIGRAEILFWPIQRAKILHWWLIVAVAAMIVGYQALHRLVSRS